MRCTLLSILTVVLSLVLIGPALAAPLTYKLQPGMELVYEGTSQSTGSYTADSSDTAHVWVLRANDDGSHRVLIAEQSTARYPHEDAPVTRTRATAVDVAPDGRLSPPASLHGPDPSKVFPPLPQGDLENWEDTSSPTYAQRYSVAAKDADTLTLVAEITGPMARIYGSHGSTHYTIDLEKGLMVRSRVDIVQDGDGLRIETKGTQELKSVQIRDQAFIQTLAEQSQLCLDARDAYYEALASATRPEELDATRQAFAAVAEQIGDPVFKTLADDILALHAQYADYYRERITEQTAIVGQPAPAWELKDLDGNVHRLSDYRGRVIILDFWYRGCGWCIMAMPQMNQLTADYKDKPVAILGINTDADIADAQHVAQEMELVYPTLLGPDMPARYKVAAFPSLVFIDAQGVVREIHEGYSPELRHIVSQKIDALLSDSAASQDGSSQDTADHAAAVTRDEADD